jgi:hypothetical protein
MTLHVATTFSNPNLPKATPLRQQILSDPSLLAWFRADPLNVTQASGAISQFNDLKGSAALMRQTTSTLRGPLVDAAIAGFSAASFDGTDDIYTWAGTTEYPLTSPYGWVVLFKADPTLAVEGQVVSKYTSSSANARIAITTAGAVKGKHGSGECTISGIGLGNWCLAILSTDGVVTRFRANGMEAVPVANNNTPGTTQPLSIGGPRPGLAGIQFKGLVSDWLMVTQDLIANREFLSMIERDFVETYGLDITPADPA